MGRGGSWAGDEYLYWELRTDRIESPLTPGIDFTTGQGRTPGLRSETDAADKNAIRLNQRSMRYGAEGRS